MSSSSSSLSLSHNERIAAKRERTCLEFMETTSTNISTAKHYMKQTAYNLERAVSLYYENDGEGLPSDNDDDDDENNNSNNNNKLTMGDRIVRNNTDRNTEVDDPISAIMDAIIKKEKPQEPSSLSSSLFVGKGFSLNDSGSSSNSNNNSTNQNNTDEPSSSSSSSTTTLEIIVVFYKDGFTAQEDEKQDDTTKSTVQRRRRGVHSFSSSESSSSLRRILLLPPLRTYEENQQFIQDVKEKRVPVEFRRVFDNSRRPIPVSISLDDRRSTNYPFDEWEKQEKEKSCLFGGTGNTLGGGYSSSSSSSTRISNHYVNNNNENGYVASILCFLISLWNLIVVTIHKLWCMTRTTIVPLQEHVVDPEKSTTTISIRIMSSSGNNKREQVVFNTDHTVNDVKRYCRRELLKKEAVDDTVVGEEQEFELLAGFPPKVVDDGTQKSLEELGLLNSAIEIRILSTIDEKRCN